MTPKDFEKKYARYLKIGGKWAVYLQIDHQGFMVTDERTKKEAKWYARQLGIALHRMIETEKNNL
jgi:hypothetical protein